MPAKPVLLVVDDDEEARRRPGARPRAARTASATASSARRPGREALETLRRSARTTSRWRCCWSTSGCRADDRRRAPRAGEHVSAPKPSASCSRPMKDAEAAIQALKTVRDRPLPAEAVAAARAEPLPRARRPAGRLGGRVRPPVRRRPRRRLPILATVAPDARLPRPQLRALPVARSRARRGGAPAAGGRRREGARACPSSSSPTARSSCSRRTRRSRRRSACRCARRRRSTTS